MNEKKKFLAKKFGVILTKLMNKKKNYRIKLHKHM